jgi:hypothetical protein
MIYIRAFITINKQAAYIKKRGIDFLIVAELSLFLKTILCKSSQEKDGKLPAKCAEICHNIY